MALKKGTPKIPKGYEPGSTSYRVITETTYYKPYKEAKALRGKSPKEYVQPVRIVGKAPKDKGKRGR